MSANKTQGSKIRNGVRVLPAGIPVGRKKASALLRYWLCRSGRQRRDRRQNWPAFVLRRVHEIPHALRSRRQQVAILLKYGPSAPSMDPESSPRGRGCRCKRNAAHHTGVVRGARILFIEVETPGAKLPTGIQHATELIIKNTHSRAHVTKIHLERQNNNVLMAISRSIKVHFESKALHVSKTESQAHLPLHGRVAVGHAEARGNRQHRLHI